MVGRNDLCPCGSGKKYKKCCLVKDEAKEIARNRITYGKSQIESVIQKVVEFANKEQYKNYKNKCELDFGIGNYELESFMNIYYLTNYKYSKQSSIMFDYFNRNKQTLNKNSLEIIENILDSYMSIYEVKEKDINKILLRDILLNQNVYVEDIDLFSCFEVKDYLLARIVPVGNTKIFLDKSTKIDEDRKNKIKTEIDNRYRDTKKKTKNKKQCLINNVKLMYENIIEVYNQDKVQAQTQLEKTFDKPINPINNEVTDKTINKTDKPAIKEDKKIIENKIKEQNIKMDLEKNKVQMDGQIKKEILKEGKKQVEKSKIKQSSNQNTQNNIPKTQVIIAKVKKVRKQILARKTSKSNIDQSSKNKKMNKKLEQKLRQRLELTRKLQEKKKASLKPKLLEQSSLEKSDNIQKTNSELMNKIENIPTYKVEQIESKIENNIVAQIATTTIVDPKKREFDLSNKLQEKTKSNHNQLQINHEKMNKEQANQEQCEIYNLLMSNVEKEYIDKCIKAWKQFKKHNKSYKGSEKGWAAAIEYSVKKIIDETTTQEQISKKYNISVKTLGKRYKELKIS